MSRTIATALIAAFLASPAMAQSVCGDRGDFLSHLSHNYAEAPVAMGLVSNGTILEVLVSKNGSWTVIVTRPDGTSCLLAAGEAWEELPTLAAGPAT